MNVRERERERESSVVGLLRLDCTFPFFFRMIVCLPWQYISISLHKRFELKLEKWVEMLVWSDGITESKLQTVVCKEVEKCM